MLENRNKKKYVNTGGQRIIVGGEWRDELNRGVNGFEDENGNDCQ